MSKNFHHSLNQEGQEGSLWMGNVRDYMTQSFIKEAFAEMGETVTAVEHVTIKASTGVPGYCFVHFKDRLTALRVMFKLNGEDIPNTNPRTQFLLKKSYAGRTSQESTQALWVGNLDKSVTDSELFMAFASLYPSVTTARVIRYNPRDKLGGSRGYAFVGFEKAAEMMDALRTMDGFRGLRDRPIRVDFSSRNMNTYGWLDKGGGSGDQSQPSPDQNPHRGNYPAWQQHNWWQGAQYSGNGYQGYNPWAHLYSGAAAGPVPAAATTTTAAAAQPAAEAADAGERDDDSESEESLDHADLESQELEFARGSEECWDAIEASRWPPEDSGLSPGLELFISS